MTDIPNKTKPQGEPLEQYDGGIGRYYQSDPQLWVVALILAMIVVYGFMTVDWYLTW